MADHALHDFHTSGPRDVSESADNDLLFYNGERIIEKPKPNYVFTGEGATLHPHGSDSGGKNCYGTARDMFRDIDSNNYNSLEGRARRANEELHVKTLSEWERNIEVLKSNKANEFSMNNLAEMPLAVDSFMHIKDALDYNFSRAANAKKNTPEPQAANPNLLANFLSAGAQKKFGGAQKIVQKVNISRLEKSKHMICSSTENNTKLMMKVIKNKMKRYAQSLPADNTRGSNLLSSVIVANKVDNDIKMQLFESFEVFKHLPDKSLKINLQEKAYKILLNKNHNTLLDGGDPLAQLESD